jgi:hypothetical protein
MKKPLDQNFYSNGAYCLICHKEYTEFCFWNKHIFGDGDI